MHHQWCNLPRPSQVWSIPAYIPAAAAGHDHGLLSQSCLVGFLCSVAYRLHGPDNPHFSWRTVWVLTLLLMLPVLGTWCFSSIPSTESSPVCWYFQKVRMDHRVRMEHCGGDLPKSPLRLPISSWGIRACCWSWLWGRHLSGLGRSCGFTEVILLAASADGWGYKLSNYNKVIMC